MTPRHMPVHLASNSTQSEPPNPPGRQCKHEECDMKLSVYNHGKYCTIHEDDIRPRTHWI